MSNRMWVATRKGLFRLHQQASRWQVDQVSFLGHPVSLVFDDPRESAVYAALNLGHFGVKLHRSDDEGASWTEVAAPAYAPQEDGKGPTVLQIWSIAAAGPEVTDGLWVGTLPGGLFRTQDRGATWRLNTELWDLPERAAWFGGGAEHPGIHSVCVDPRDANHVLIAVSCGGVWRSRDGGSHWEIGGPGMYADYMPEGKKDDPAVQDPHCMVQCRTAPDALWVQHHNGVFRSTDGAATWSGVDNLRPSAFGFPVVVHPYDSETAWFVPAVKDEVRIPVGGQLSVTRTRNGGASCDVLTAGLPQEHCYDLVYRHALDIDGTGDQLAFGSTTGHLWTTTNQGDSWRQLPYHLPPIYAVRYASRA